MNEENRVGFSKRAIALILDVLFILLIIFSLNMSTNIYIIFMLIFSIYFMLIWVGTLFALGKEKQTIYDKILKTAVYAC